MKKKIGFLGGCILLMAMVGFLAASQAGACRCEACGSGEPNSCCVTIHNENIHVAIRTVPCPGEWPVKEEEEEKWKAQYEICNLGDELVDVTVRIQGTRADKIVCYNCGEGGPELKQFPKKGKYTITWFFDSLPTGKTTFFATTNYPFSDAKQLGRITLSGETGDGTGKSASDSMAIVENGGGSTTFTVGRDILVPSADGGTAHTKVQVFDDFKCFTRANGTFVCKDDEGQLFSIAGPGDVKISFVCETEDSDCVDGLFYCGTLRKITFIEDGWIIECGDSPGCKYVNQGGRRRRICK